MINIDNQIMTNGENNEMMIVNEETMQKPENIEAIRKMTKWNIEILINIENNDNETIRKISNENQSNEEEMTKPEIW